MIVLVLGLLAAAPTPAEIKLAAPGLTVSGLDASTAGPLTDHLAHALAGVHVITARDIGALLGLERQKELLGCTDSSSGCMAELANALGVQGVLLGDVVKLGGAVQINVRIIDPVAGRELAAAAERVDAEDQIFDALNRAGASLRHQFFAALHVSEPAPPAAGIEASRGSRRFFPYPLIAGGVLAIAGAVSLVFSATAYQRLTQGGQGSLTGDNARGIASNGGLFETLGIIGVSVGAVAVVAGFGLLVFGTTGGGPQASIAIAPNGAVLSGSF